MSIPRLGIVNNKQDFLDQFILDQTVFEIDGDNDFIYVSLEKEKSTIDQQIIKLIEEKKIKIVTEIISDKAFFFDKFENFHRKQIDKNFIADKLTIRSYAFVNKSFKLETSRLSSFWIGEEINFKENQIISQIFEKKVVLDETQNKGDQLKFFTYDVVQEGRQNMDIDYADEQIVVYLDIEHYNFFKGNTSQTDLHYLLSDTLTSQAIIGAVQKIIYKHPNPSLNDEDLNDENTEGNQQEVVREAWYNELKDHLEYNGVDLTKEYEDVLDSYTEAAKIFNESFDVKDLKNKSLNQLRKITKEE